MSVLQKIPSFRLIKRFNNEKTPKDLLLEGLTVKSS